MSMASSSSSSSSSSPSVVAKAKQKAAAVIFSAAAATAASGAARPSSSSLSSPLPLPSSSSSFPSRLLLIRGGSNNDDGKKGRGRGGISNNISSRRKVPPPQRSRSPKTLIKGFGFFSTSKNEKVKSSSSTKTTTTTTTTKPISNTAHTHQKQKQPQQQQQSEKEGLAAVIACSLLSIISSFSEFWLIPIICIAITTLYVIYPISLLLLFRISELISLVKLFEHSHYCRASSYHNNNNNNNNWINHCTAVVIIHGIQLTSIIGTIIWYKILVNKKKKMKQQQQQQQNATMMMIDASKSVITNNNNTYTKTSSSITNKSTNNSTSNNNPLTTILKVWTILLLLGMFVFKSAVDDWLLFQLAPPDATQAISAKTMMKQIIHQNKLKGKVAIVTGANRGIGLATAKALVERGANVVLTCRSIAKCQPIVDDINNNNNNNNNDGLAVSAVLDLSNLESALTLSKELTSKYPEIHYVFANAGTTPQYPLTDDGYEDGFGGMHLAHMTLILGLLPSLRNAATETLQQQQGNLPPQPSRVIMVSSEMAINAAIGIFGKEPIFRSSLDKDDEVEDEEEEGSIHTSTLLNDLQDVHGQYTRGDGTLGTSLPAYGRAKLCNVLFALELNRRMIEEAQQQQQNNGGDDNDDNSITTTTTQPLVIANAVHTGAVDTDSSRGSISNTFRWIPGLSTIVRRIYFPLLWRDVDGGARVLLCAALSDADYVIKGGQYLDALCHPFLPPSSTTTTTTQTSTTTSNSNKQYKGMTVSFSPKWEIHTDPIYALMEADRKWSGRLWNVSIALLKDSVASDVVQYAPPLLLQQQQKEVVA